MPRGKKKQSKKHGMKKKQHSAAAAAGRVFFVPQDVIIQVLKELPAKSLLRFRTVSKLWCSVIDDPLFAKQHHLARGGGGSDGIKLILIKDPYPFSKHYEFYSVDRLDAQGLAAFFGLRTLNERVHIWPIHCVNGLVCLGDRIWNPATNQSIRFPPRELNAYYPSTSEAGRHVRLMYTNILFGYDGSCNAYKVLQLSYFGDYSFGFPLLQENALLCKVWTVGTSSTWRDFSISNIPSDLNFLYVDKSCVVGNVIYCLGSIGRDKHCLPLEWRIFAFDVQQEKLIHIISLPDFYSTIPPVYGCGPSLINVRGYLGLVDRWMTTISVLGKQGYWLDEKLLLPHEWRVWSPKTGDLNFHDPFMYGFILVGTLPTGDVLFQLTKPLSHDQETTEISYFCYDLGSKKTRKFLEFTEVDLGDLQPKGNRGWVVLLSYVETVFRLSAAR